MARSQETTQITRQKIRSLSLIHISWVAELEKGVTYENTITSPQLEGFSVDQSTVTFSGKVETDQTITVTYTGTATTYTVKHLLQNTDGKTYTEDASETIDGTTGTTTVAAARAYKGFTSQEVNQAKVNADGSLSLIHIQMCIRDRCSRYHLWC